MVFWLTSTIALVKATIIEAEHKNHEKGVYPPRDTKTS